MDGRGGCCITKYVGGGAAGVYNTSKIDRIMLRFRPIAPKPPSGGAVSGGGSASDSTKDPISKRGGRGKRKGVSRSVGGGNRKRKSCSSSDGSDDVASSTVENWPVVTLPLLPETPDLKVEDQSQSKLPTWLDFGSHVSGAFDEDRRAVVVPRKGEVTVGSWVTVERVTDTWVEGESLGRTDEEIRKRLETDTCPGFISDGWNRVWWANEAFQKMTWQEGRRMTWLVMKERMPVTCQAFTCRVRVQRSHGGMENKGSATSSLTCPCDAWRLDSGGFAWRLDVDSALSLSLGR